MAIKAVKGNSLSQRAQHLLSNDSKLPYMSSIMEAFSSQYNFCDNKDGKGRFYYFDYVFIHRILIDGHSRKQSFVRFTTSKYGLVLL